MEELCKFASIGKHNIIDHDKELADANHNHINGIEGFWSFAKERFHKYHGIDKRIIRSM